jgi:CheY-like chemotaxis protein
MDNNAVLPKTPGAPLNAQPDTTQSEAPDVRYNILIVEDEPDASAIFKALLEPNKSYVIYDATNGVDALKKMEQVKFDLVLLDIIMPKMDGIEALKQIKQNPDKYGYPTVIMLTNVGGEVAENNAKELKADGYLLKIEIEPEELIKKVEEALQKRTSTPSSDVVAPAASNTSQATTPAQPVMSEDQAEAAPFPAAVQ